MKVLSPKILLNLYTYRDWDGHREVFGAINVLKIQTIVRNAVKGTYIIRMEEGFTEISERNAERLFDFIEKQKTIITPTARRHGRYFTCVDTDGKKVVVDLNGILAMNENTRGEGYYVHLSSTTGIQISKVVGEELFQAIEDWQYLPEEEGDGDE